MELSLTTIKLRKEQYLQLIAAGGVEDKALETVGLPKATYIRLIDEDPDFAKNIEKARKHRAEHWIGKIVESVDEEYEVLEELPNAKLRFEKLQYLAKADNPDRYGAKASGANININLGEFKLLKPEEAMAALAADPFAIEAEFTTAPVADEDLL
jgi:hypothetical protein